MIREFDAESSSHQTVSSASQSPISAFSAENSKIVRMLAHFLRSEGTGEAQIRPSVADLCSILSIENRAGALRLNLRSYLGSLGTSGTVTIRHLGQVEEKLPLKMSVSLAHPAT